MPTEHLIRILKTALNSWTWSEKNETGRNQKGLFDQWMVRNL